MKLIKINSNHYVVVDDSEIEKDDWYLDDTNTPRQANENTPIITDHRWWYSYECESYWTHRKNYKKITHSTQPLEDRDNSKIIFPSFMTQEVKELIGEVDVENKAKYKFPNDTPNGLKIGTSSYKQRGFISGYNQALEDNKKKKYTFNQITDAISMAREINGKESYYRYSMEEIVQSVEPKTSWEVEIVDGKLKLK